MTDIDSRLHELAETIDILFLARAGFSVPLIEEELEGKITTASKDMERLMRIRELARGRRASSC